MYRTALEHEGKHSTGSPLSAKTRELVALLTAQWRAAAGRCSCCMDDRSTRDFSSSVPSADNSPRPARLVAADEATQHKAGQTLAELREADRVIFRHVENSNGSVDEIAGICSRATR